MERLNFINYDEHNGDYNKTIKPLVDEIFQQKDVGYIDYIMSDTDSFEGNRHIITPEHDKSINPQNIENKVIGLRDFSKLGINERALTIYLLESTYDIIVLSGAMGSGKSSTSRYVLDFIENNYVCKEQDDCKTCKIKKISTIRLDFNKGFSGANTERILDNFSRQFYLQLKRNIKPIYSLDNLIFEKFLERILDRSNHEWEHEFEEFLSDYIENDELNWDDKPKIMKCNIFFNWIDSQSDYLTKIDLLGYLIYFIIQEKFIKKECIIIFFDNIDQLPEIAQNQIITLIFQFTEISRAKTLLTVRLTSFGWIPAKASYTWGQFQHAGPTPATIINKRISHYLNNKLVVKKYIDLRTTIGESFLTLLDKRLELVSEYFSDRDSRLHKFIFSISGNSIRRGLFLMVRVFFNNNLNYENTSPYEDELIRCLLLGTNKNCKFDPEDRLINNLFCNPISLSPSFLKIRILQLLLSYYERKHVLTLQNLIDDLYLFYKRINSTDFRYNINDLLNDRRKLIYIDGIGKYNSDKEMFTSPDDKVNISITGKKYIEYLVHDLVYIQESFMPINWPTESGMPQEYNFDSFVERLTVIRKGLKLFLEYDYESMLRFVKKENKFDNKTKLFISSSIIYQIANSINNIFRKQSDITKKQREEFIYWVDLLIIVFNYYNKLFSTKNDKIGQLINTFRKNYNIEISP